MTRTATMAILTGGVGLCLVGCGDSADPVADNDSAIEDVDSALGLDDEETGAVPASIPPQEDAPPVQSAEVTEGSPEAILREIGKLRVERLPDAENPQQLRNVRHTRNTKIIDLATEAIKLTHQSPDQERLFNLAVQYLADARMQLALQGEQEHIDGLYADADSLYERDPESEAAAAAGYMLARFAHTSAQRFAQKDSRWLEEFADQATRFATRFPHDEKRAATLLFASGRSCELHGLMERATTCYETLKRKFPKSNQASTVVAILRRLKLPGSTLKLAGPTIDGGFLKLESYRGRAVLVVFWSSDAAPFLEQLPELVTLQRDFPQLRIVGVNLDEDEPSVDAFLEEYRLNWPTIFYSDREQRRWNNPIVNYYGVRDIPSIWLVGPDGKVLDTRLQVAQLRQRLERQASSGRRRQ